MRKLILTTCAAAVLAVMAAGCCGNSGKKYVKSLPDGFDALCERAITEWKVPGMAVGVVKDGEVVLLKGYGKASIENDEPVTPQTRFVIASTSKAFTSALLANVMDEYDTIKWDAPVVDYLPDFKLYDPWVTRNFQVREIMTHHTGFKGYALDDLPFFGYDRDELYTLFGTVQPSYSFRTTYAYNNEMYTVAARIIEKFTGKSWDQAIAERLFAPLEMKNSTTGNVAFLQPDNGLAAGYRLVKAEGKDSVAVVVRTDREDAFTWLSAVAPAGFVMSTAEDMTHWLQMHLNHGVYNGRQIVSRKNHDYLFYPQTIVSCDSARLSNYAQGWTIEQNDYGRYIRHTGLAYGYTALVGLVPNLNLGFVFLTNNGTDADAQSALARDLIALYHGEKHPGYFDQYHADFLKGLFKERQPETEAPEPAPALANKAYTGAYYLEGFGQARIYERGDSLFFRLKKVDSYLQHKDGNVFTFRVPGAGRFDLTFKPGPSGRAASFTFDINDPIGDFKRTN